MLSRLLSRLTYANVVSSLALFLVLTGGTAVALSGTDTVFSDDIVDGQVRSADVADDGLTASDVGPNAVGGSEITAGSVIGLDVANDSPTGSDVREDLLGPVPRAERADNGGRQIRWIDDDGGTTAEFVRIVDERGILQVDCADGAIILQVRCATSGTANRTFDRNGQPNEVGGTPLTAGVFDSRRITNPAEGQEEQIEGRVIVTSDAGTLVLPFPRLLAGRPVLRGLRRRHARPGALTLPHVPPEVPRGTVPPVRVGLVLGAGGVLGGAWLTGGLHALATVTRWDPASADRIVGTSAGSMMAALLGGGVPPWFMVAHQSGERFEGLVDARGRPAEEADRTAGAVFRLHKGPPPVGPGSWKLALRALTNPTGHRAAALGAGWLPRGVISTEPLKDTVRAIVPEGWADHPGLWICTADYATGRRVTFGRPGAPPADLADAVAASCAIPGFYRPVRIGGRRYVDGGLWSPSNLDVVAREGLDLVICLNPTSSLEPSRAWNPALRVAELMRTASGRRLGLEARRIRETGTPLVLVQPTARDHAVMGPNLMSRRNMDVVIRTATETVAEQLERAEHRDALAALPAGDPAKIERPPGPVESWPEDLLPMRRAAATTSRAA